MSLPGQGLWPRRTWGPEGGEESEGQRDHWGAKHWHDWKWGAVGLGWRSQGAWAAPGLGAEAGDLETSGMQQLRHMMLGYHRPLGRKTFA